MRSLTQSVRTYETRVGPWEQGELLGNSFLFIKHSLLAATLLVNARRDETTINGLISQCVLQQIRSTLSVWLIKKPQNKSYNVSNYKD